MAPRKPSRPIPTGWSLKHGVLEDGSKCSYYYCQQNGQHFPSYAALMRYVKYAKKDKVGIYSPSHKSCKQSKEREDSASTKSRKISGLSIRSVAPSEKSESSTDDEDMFSQSSSDSESSDREADPDYMPPSNSSSIKADSQPSETELEVGQVSFAEAKDLESDGHTSA